MSLQAQQTRERMARFREALRRAGVKATHQRLEIFREVAASGDHPDAQTVYEGVRERMPTVSLDTVYRTLWLLLDLEQISTLGAPRDRARFEANIGPHHHFVCTRCGMARDLPADGLEGIEVPEAARELGSVERTHVEFRGVCARCEGEMR